MEMESLKIGHGEAGMELKNKLKINCDLMRANRTTHVARSSFRMRTRCTLQLMKTDRSPT